MADLEAVSAKHATLSAATVDTVTLTGSGPAFEVVNRASSGAIYFTCAPEGGSAATPTVAGDNTTVVPAGKTVLMATPGSGGVIVKLISAAADAYSVQLVGELAGE